MDRSWDCLGEFDVERQISISDSSYFYDNPLLVPAEKGKYAIFVRYMSVTIHRHIAAVRVVQQAVQQRSLTRGAQVGAVLVDFAQIAICDRQAAEAAFDMLGDQKMPIYYDQLDTTALTCWALVPPRVKFAIVRPGFGDGEYPVFELVGSHGEQAGIEIDCMLPTEL